MSDNKLSTKQLQQRHFDEMIDQLFSPIAVQPFNEIQDFSDALDIEAFCRDNNFDRKLYCSITGQPIGTMDDSVIKRLLKTHSRIPSADRLRYAQMGTKDPAWMDTGNLTELSHSDPYGYYVYAASFCLRVHYDSLHENALEAQWKFHVEKVAMYQTLLSVPSDTVIAANAAWRDFLAFVSPSRIKLAFVWPKLGAEFGSLEFANGVAKTLKGLIVSLVMKEIGYGAGFAYYAAQRINDKYKGLSNFRASARINGETESEFYDRTFRSMGIQHKEVDIARSYTGLSEKSQRVRQREIIEDSKISHGRPVVKGSANLSLNVSSGVTDSSGAKQTSFLSLMQSTLKKGV